MERQEQDRIEKNIEFFRRVDEILDKHDEQDLNTLLVFTDYDEQETLD